MSVVRGYRIRAYPSGAQRRLLEHWFGAKHWLWNHALEIRSAAYRERGLRLTGNDLSRWLTLWKRTRGHEWLANVPATCLAQCLRDQDRAFANFFAKRAKYPRFRRRGTHPSLRFQDVGSAWCRGELRLPKLGRVKLAEKLPETARPDMVTLWRDGAGRYFVSFAVEVDMAPLAATGRSIGVDLGLKSLATLSNGEKIENPRRYHARLRYLRQQQRALSRKAKSSRRRARQRVRLARAHAHVRDQRQYALHALTTRLVREFDVICIEDLNVRALARGLHARAIHDAAFSEFRRQLEYKTKWYGRTVRAIDRYFPSTKRCSGCGHVLDEMRLDVRTWTCPKCGCDHDRDVNAAMNLLADGLRQLGPRDGGDLRADGEGSCPGAAPAQVSPREARSGPLTGECPEQDRVSVERSQGTSQRAQSRGKWRGRPERGAMAHTGRAHELFSAGPSSSKPNHVSRARPRRLRSIARKSLEK